LFKGLAIHDQWDWPVRHPVLRLSFGSGNFKEPDNLHKETMARLSAVEKVDGCDTAPAYFRHCCDAASTDRPAGGGAD